MTRRLAPALAALAGIVAIIGAAAFLRHDSTPPPAVREGLSLPGNQPFINGKLMTLPEAAAAVGYTIYRPEATIANDANLEEVWVEVQAADVSNESPDGFIKHVALNYSSGVRVYLDRPAYEDASTHYADLAPGLGFVGEVLGVPAWKLPRIATLPKTTQGA